MSDFREIRSWRRVRLTLVREKAEPYARPRIIRRGDEAAAMLRAFLGDDPRESFAALYLDGRHGPIAIHAASIGTAQGTLVTPREVFGPALMLGAVAVIVAHNHPSGDSSPSSEDGMVTERLKKVGELVGVEVLDHLVIGADSYFSFTEQAARGFTRKAGP